MSTLKVASLNLFRTLKACLPVSPYLLIINKVPLNHNEWVVLPEIAIIILWGIRVHVIWSACADWRSIMTSIAVALQLSGFKMEKGFAVQIYFSTVGDFPFCLYSAKNRIYSKYFFQKIHFLNLMFAFLCSSYYMSSVHVIHHIRFFVTFSCMNRIKFAIKVKLVSCSYYKEIVALLSIITAGFLFKTHLLSIRYHAYSSV